METSLLRSVAFAFGVGACSIVQAQFGATSATPVEPGSTPGQATSAGEGYRAPGKWSRYRPEAAAGGASLFRPVSDRSVDLTAATQDRSAESIPVPEAAPESAPSSAQEQASHGQGIVGSGRAAGVDGSSAAAGTPAEAGSGTVIEDPATSNVYLDAMRSSWAASGPVTIGGHDGSVAPLPISPWFGSSSILFLDVEDAHDRRLIYEDADQSMSRLWSRDADPESSVGYELSLGRYLGCGRFGVAVSYFHFDPDGESSRLAPASPGDYQAAMPVWNNISIDPSSGANPAGAANGGDDTIYNYYDEAAAYRVRRDLDFQGIEANLFSFGIVGAQRAGGCGGHGLLGMFDKVNRWLASQGGAGYGCGPASSCGPKNGFGGGCGPLVRPCGGRIQLVTGHGFRWFQIRDSFGFDANIDGTPGYQPTDLFHDVDTENNLFGYQFGGRLLYCLCNRINLSVAGKFGIYGNDIDVRQRLGTRAITSYYNNFPGEFVNSEASDTVLATLGELDLGVGFRVCNAWTIRGGYRLIGASGIATATGSVSQDYASSGPNSRVYADDSLILHGGYVSTEYNW